MRVRTSFGVATLLSTAVCLLLFQIWFLHRLREAPVISGTALPLDGFPSAIGRWRCKENVPAEPLPSGARDADEMLTRTYEEETSGLTVNLVVAYYRSQIHVHQQYDLEEYLPGQGWSQSSVTIERLPQPKNLRVPVRYELFLRGPERRVVIRWFETKDRVVATGAQLRLYRFLDVMAHRRTDFARVQMVAPVPNDSSEQAQQNVLLFAQRVIELTRSFLFRG